MSLQSLFGLFFLLSAAESLSRISLRVRPSGERSFVDEHGREVIFHGVNAVVKGPPWVPVHDVFSLDVSLTDQDFAIMARHGLNLVRLGAMWPGIEPQVSHPLHEHANACARMNFAHAFTPVQV